MNKVKMTEGAKMIAAERTRQIDEEGYSIEEDYKLNSTRLASAASAYLYAYILHPDNPSRYGASPPSNFPFHRTAWKPSDPIRTLVKVGALIAAEIDRLLYVSQEEYEMVGSLQNILHSMETSQLTNDPDIVHAMKRIQERLALAGTKDEAKN